MCLCCWGGTRKERAAYHRVRCLQALCFFFTVVGALFLHAAIHLQVPWFRMTLRGIDTEAGGHLSNEAAAEHGVNHRASPWPYAIGGLGEPALRAGNQVGYHWWAEELPVWMASVFQRDNDTTTVAQAANFLQRPMESIRDFQNTSHVSNGPLTNTSESKPLSLPRPPGLVPWEERLKKDGGDGNGKPLLQTVWFLRTINITVPALHNISRVIAFQDLTSDTVFSAAVFLAGFRETVYELDSSTALVELLGAWALAIAAASAACFFFGSLQALWVGSRQTECAPPSERRLFWQSSSTILEPLLIPSQPEAILNRRNCRAAVVWKSPPSRKFLVMGGILSVFNAAFLTVGYLIWLTRSLDAARRVFASLARFIGVSAAEWVRSHSDVEADVGLVLFGASAFLCAVVGITALCVERLPSNAMVVYIPDDPHLVADTTSAISDLGYQPISNV